MLSRLMTNLSAHSAPALLSLKLPLWIAALLAAFLAVYFGAFVPNAGAPGTESSIAHATASGAPIDLGAKAAEPSDRAERLEQVVDSRAAGIRLIKVRLGPDRTAERRSDLDTIAETRDFGPDPRTLRLISESVPAGSDREGIPPLYHLHAALLI